jgi:hypothetical protein
VVYWVIAKAVLPSADTRAAAVTVGRLGPFASRDLAVKARDEAAPKYRERAGAKLEIVCDIS